MVPNHNKNHKYQRDHHQQQNYYYNYYYDYVLRFQQTLCETFVVFITCISRIITTILSLSSWKTIRSNDCCDNDSTNNLLSHIVHNDTDKNDIASIDSEEKDATSQHQQVHQEAGKSDLDQWNNIVRNLFTLNNNNYVDHDDTRHLPRSSSSSSSSSSLGITLIPYLQQEYTWDCGITCLQMIFLWLLHIPSLSTSTSTSTNDSAVSITDTSAATRRGSVDDNNSIENLNARIRNWMIQTVDTESIWTIDLIYLIREFIEQKHTILQQHYQQEQTNPSNKATTTTIPFNCNDDATTITSTTNATTSTTNFSYVMITNSLLIDHNFQNLNYYNQTFQQDCIRITKRLKDITVIPKQSNNNTKIDNNKHDTDYSNLRSHHSYNNHNNSNNNNNCINMSKATSSSSSSSSFINNSGKHSPIQQYTNLSIHQIIHCIQYMNCIAIALVDNSILTTYHNNNNTKMSQPRRRRSNTSPTYKDNNHINDINNKQYVGHYIIIVGISYDPNHIQQATLNNSDYNNDDNNGKTKTTTYDNNNNNNCCLVVYNPGCCSNYTASNNTTRTKSTTINYENGYKIIQEEISNPTSTDRSITNTTNTILTSTTANTTSSVSSSPSSSVSSSSISPMYISLNHFEHAWRAYGTDEDIILIVRH